MLSPMNDTCNVSLAIPQSRQQLMELCLAEGRLSPSDAARFRRFCELLAAHTHFQFHHINELLKQSYLPFNPDVEDAQRRRDPNANSASAKTQLIDTLAETLTRANYAPLDWVAIMQAIQASDLVDLRTEIDFHDFEHVMLYHRGQQPGQGARKKLLWKQRIDMHLYSNVLLGLQFKNESYFGERLYLLLSLPGHTAERSRTALSQRPYFDELVRSGSLCGASTRGGHLDVDQDHPESITFVRCDCLFDLWSIVFRAVRGE